MSEKQLMKMMLSRIALKTNVRVIDCEVGEMPAHLWGSSHEGWTSERVSESEVR
jgi:hypothetical protein